MDVNILGVVVAAVGAFVLGGLWYSPVLFGKIWQREVGLTEEQVKAANMPLIFGGAFVLSLIAAFVFAMFLGPDPSPALAIGAGVSAGLCWVGASFGINYLFAQRSLKLFLIDAGYNTGLFTVFGLVLGLWP